MTLALDGSAHATGGATSQAVTLTTASSGDIILVAVVSNGSGIASVTASGLTFAKRASTNLAGGGSWEELWWAYAASPLSSKVITVTQNGSAFITVDAFGVSSTIGFNSSNPFDSNGALPGLSPSTGANAVASTTASNSFILGAYRMASVSNPTAGSGFTLISGADFGCVEYKIASSPQTSLALTLTSGAGDMNAGIADALVEISGGGSTKIMRLSALGVG